MSPLSKKILLLKPDYQFFPIGFGYVVAALKRAHIEFDFVDGFLEKNIDLKRLMAENDYCAVASGGLIGSYTWLKNVFSDVKAVDPTMPCILGGNITIDVKSKLLFSLMPVDYLVVGEGEETFPELLIALEEGKPITTVDGVSFRDEAGEVVKARRRRKLNIETDNWMPDWSFFDIKAYGFQVMPVMTGRGCSGRCTFCSPTNGSFRARPLEHIMEEITLLNEQYDFVHFVFMNEIIFPDDETIIEFCEQYKKIEPFKPWHCLMRMDVDPRVLDHMRDAGCTLMNVGVESGSDRVLAVVQKDLTVKETKSFIASAKHADIPILASFLTAHYDERPEDIAATVDLLLELKISGPMAMTINYPGTRNYALAKKRGLIGDEGAYIDSLDDLYSRNYYQVISGHRSKTLNYLNLSAMDDDLLFRTVEREMRRYYSEGFAIENATVSAATDEWRIDFAGSCPFCGGAVSKTLRSEIPHPMDLRAECLRCGDKDIYFDPFAIPKYAEWSRPLRDQLPQVLRPALIGSYDDLRLFFMYDHFGFRYDRLVGGLAHGRLRPGYALNLPLLDAEGLLKADPDCLVVVGDIPSEDKKRIMNGPLTEGREILYLSPYLRRQFTDAISSEARACEAKE